MAQWDSGYVTDVAYTTHYYREITPSWLSLTSVLLGQRPPNLAQPFSYADLGCGNGFTTLVVAATYPHADVWGFDFNPAHIEFASGLAARAGLSNVHFVETSFAQLAAQPDNALPGFDFTVSHGVLSWISPENQRELISIIARRLKPGGLAYFGYNVTTGWAALVPVRQLMHMLALARPERTDLAAAGVLDFIDRLKQAGAGYFQANQGVESRLQDIRKQDARYIAHEYLNRDWHPLMFADVAAAMAEAKCRYVGSATLAENIDTVSVPPNVLPLMSETRDPVLRETLRDFGCAQAFRRDVYRRGLAPMPPAEQQAVLEALTLVELGRPIPEGGVSFATPVGTVTGLPEVYQPLIEMLHTAPLSLAQARAIPELAGKGMVELVQAFTLLVAGGYAYPLLPDGGTVAGAEASRRLNLTIAQANASGADLLQMAAPAIGSAVGTDMLETQVVGELLAGRPTSSDQLATEILQTLSRSGRSVQRDGKSVSDPGEARGIVADAVGRIMQDRVPVLRRLGVLQG